MKIKANWRGAKLQRTHLKNVYYNENARFYDTLHGQHELWAANSVMLSSVGKIVKLFNDAVPRTQTI
jgi:hypothetical protein